MPALTWFPFAFAGFDGLLLDLAIKATFILALTVSVNAVLRRPSASLRHAVHSLGLLALLLLPVFSLALPTWRIGLPIAISTDPAAASTLPRPDVTARAGANGVPSPEVRRSTAVSVRVSPTVALDSGRGPKPTKAEVPRTISANFSLFSVTWFLGTSTVMVFTILGIVRAHHFRRASTRVEDPKWLTAFEELTSGSRWLCYVELLENAHVSVPIMCGIVRPAIILPAEYKAEAPDGRRRILTHELAHVQRFDVAVHFLGRIVCSLYWFHPLAWWCLQKMQQEREYACDDWVLASGGAASEYADQLLSVAHHHFASAKSIPAAIGIIHHTNLEQRIRLLLSDDVNHSRLKAMALVISAAAFALLTTGIAAIQPELSQAAEPPTKENSDRACAKQRSNDAENTRQTAEDGFAGVSVTCIDQRGLPVAVAEVHLYQARHYENGQNEYVHYGPYESDKEGKVLCPDELFLTRDRTFDRWVYARVPGRLVGIARSARWPNRTPFNTDFVVKLQPSQVLGGQVKVPSGFDPTGVEVRAQVLHVFVGKGPWDFQSFPRHHPFVGLDNALPETFTKRPDREGRFQFNDVPVRGRLYLLAEGDGLGQSQWRNESDRFDAPAELTLKPEGRLSGQVLSPNGKPVKDIEVSARIISNGNHEVADATTFRTVTDDGGKYAFGGLPDWDFVLSATDRENRWVVRPVEDIRVNSGKTTYQNLVLEKGRRVSGRVFDSDGRPVEGAALSAITDSKTGSGISGDSTDSDGRYSLRLPSGRVRLYFNSLPPEFTYPEPQVVKKLDVRRGQPDRYNVDFTIPRKQEGNAGEDTRIVSTADEGSQLLRDIRAASEPLLETMASQRGYGLSPNELVRHVPLPFPLERMEYYRLGHPTQSQAIPAGPSAMTFRWNGEELKNWGMNFGDSETGGYNLTGVLNALVGVKSQRLQGPPELLTKRLPGDWVVRENGDKGAIVEQLETILNEDFDLDLEITFRKVEREVYVARGSYKLTPVEGQEGEGSLQLIDRRISTDRVHIFAKGLVPDSGAGGGTGEFDEFLEWLGSWISTPIVDEVESHPRRQLSWELHARSPFTEQMRREDHEPEAVLRNVTKQTNLQFTKERRQVELLIVETAIE